MFSNFKAWVFCLLVSLSPSFAWAQLQPVPVFQAKAVVDASLSNSAGVVKIVDSSGYGSAYVRAHNADCAGGMTISFSGGSTSSTINDSGFSSMAIQTIANGVARYYEVGPLQQYTQITVNSVNGLACNATIGVLLIPFSTVQTVQGFAIESYPVSSTSRPVYVGGKDINNNAQPLLLGAGGALQVGGPIANGAIEAGYYPVLIGGSDGANARTIKTDATGAIAIGSAAPSPLVLDIHAPVAYQVTKAATTTIASPVGAGVVWKVRIQNLGNDELMIANVDPPTEAVSHRVQAGGDVWEVEWKDALYMKLKSDATTSPQVTPEDVRVTVMHY